jgi:hypothetical protein
VSSGKWDLQSNPSNTTANSSSVMFNATIDMRVSITHYRIHTNYLISKWIKVCR